MPDGSVFDDMASPGSGAPSPDDLSRFELNDVGNAMRLLRLAGGLFDDKGEPDLAACRLLHTAELGWAVFNGQRWDFKQGQRMADRLAHKVAEGLYAQAWALRDRREKERAEAEEGGDAKAKKRKDRPDPAVEEFLDFARSSGNAGRTAAMLQQAKAYLTVDLTAFDRDPLALNCRNGTVKIVKPSGKGEAPRITFGRHNQADRITRMAEVDYLPDAKCPLWDRSLKAWQPVEDIRAFLQRASGYGCTGYTFEQVFFLFQGLGRDGKSTYMGATRELLGDYAAAADVKTFLDIGQRSGADANPDLARLAGDTRLASTAEPPRGAKLAEAMIKSFTGGAPILARHLRRDLFEFQPIPKIFMECNSFPTIKGDDDGIWRRLVPILWENQVPKDKVDRQLPAKLRAEYPGILNWLLAGACAWLKDGLNPPGRVAEALEDYRKGSSPFGEWLAEWVVIDKAEKQAATPFYTSFKEWLLARDPDARVMSQQAFGRALADRQILYAGLGGDGRVMRKGARLKTTIEHQDDYALAGPSPPVQGEASPGGSMGERPFAPLDDGPDGGEGRLPPGDWDPSRGEP